VTYQLVPLNRECQPARPSKSENPARGKRGFLMGKRGGTTSLHVGKTLTQAIWFNPASRK